MALEALRGYAGADCSAELHALGKAAVVTVQQRGGIRVQGVDLQESGCSHGFVSLLIYRLGISPFGLVICSGNLDFGLVCAFFVVTFVQDEPRHVTPVEGAPMCSQHPE